MRKRILVVDDSRITRTVIQEGLRQEGFDVVSVSNGLEANRYLYGPEQADAIILDVMMPVLQGDRFARFVRHNKHIDSIPILLLSAKPECDLQRMLEETGAYDYLTKPFRLKDLVAKVQEMTRRNVLRL